MRGLFKRGSIWYFDKVVSVPKRFALNPLKAEMRLRGSTHMTDRASAEELMTLACQQAKEEMLYGRRKNWTFNDAIPKYLETRKKGKSLTDGEMYCGVLSEYFGDVPLRFLHIDAKEVQQFIGDRQARGNKAATINHHLGVLRHILKLAHRRWRDSDLSWIESPGFIPMLPTHDETPAHVLTLGQERELLPKLPHDLQLGATLALHTGLRNSSLCNMKWSHETEIPELNTVVFDLPSNHPGLGKNHQAHRVILNSVAMSVIDELRDRDTEYVLTYRHGNHLKPYRSLLTSSWRKAVFAVGLKDCRGEGEHLRIHDLRHTFSTRLRAQGISHEDRKDFMGHKRGKNDDITTHYSAAETGHLVEQSEELVNWYSRKQASVYVKNSLHARPAKVTQLVRK